MKPLVVTHKKLGRVKINKEPVNGYADFDANTAFIEIRLKGYEHLYTFIHEVIHLQNPEWAEMKVRGHSKQLADLVWNANYRKVEL